MVFLMYMSEINPNLHADIHTVNRKCGEWLPFRPVTLNYFYFLFIFYHYFFFFLGGGDN